MSNLKRPGNPLPATIPVAPKRQQNCLTIEDKINILDRLKAGARLIDLSRECNINERYIRSLLKCEPTLRKYAEKCIKRACCSEAYTPRDNFVEKMEEELYLWHEECRLQGTVPTQSVMCAKARDIYGQLKRESQNKNEVSQLDFREFKASKTWLAKFRQRFNIDQSTIKKGESFNTAAYNLYPTTFARLIQTGGYKPQQVFSAFEFSFAWKLLPNSTFIASTDKTLDKIGNDRISLLFCSNAQGNFYVKPMLINPIRTPYCLRMAKINELPVFWRYRGRQANGMPKVTPSHFHDWLTQCYTPTVRNYLQIMEMPENSLLLLNDEMKQMVLPAYDDSFLRLEFLPAETSHLLQPLTQNILLSFQCKYMQRFFAHLLQCLEVKTKANLFKAWHKYSIADAVEIIHESLEDISTECWQSGWNRLWPEIGSELYSETQFNVELAQVVENGRQLPGEGFIDMAPDDIKLAFKLQHKNLHDVNQERGIVTNVEILQTGDQKTNDELISLCEEQDMQRGKDDPLGYIINQGECEMTINIEYKDNQVESESEEEEAIIEYHETVDIDIDEIGPMKSGKMQESNKPKTRHRDACTKIQIINKAFQLKRELLTTLEQLQRKEHFSNFNDGLNTLMEPYVELRKKLLQPTIKDYFK